MLAEAEKYKEEDDAEASRIQAKNGLESYAYSLRNTLGDEKVEEKLDAGDKEKLKKAIDETVEWLDNNTTATKVSLIILIQHKTHSNNFVGRVRVPAKGVGRSCQPYHDEVLPEPRRCSSWRHARCWRFPWCWRLPRCRWSSPTWRR